MDERQLCAEADHASVWPWLVGSGGPAIPGGRSRSSTTPATTTMRATTAAPVGIVRPGLGTQGGGAHDRRGQQGRKPGPEVTGGGRDDDDAGQHTHDQRPPGGAPTCGRDECRSGGQGQQGPAALCPDQSGEQEAQRDPLERLAEIEGQGEDQRHREQGGRGPGKGEPGRQLPVCTNMLGERIDLPEDTDDADGCRDRRHGDEGERDAAAVVIVEGLDHQIGGEKAEHGRSER